MDDDDWVGTPPEGHHSRDRAQLYQAELRLELRDDAQTLTAEGREKPQEPPRTAARRAGRCPV